MRAFPVLAVLALLAAAMPVRADPGGGDAPDDWEDARDIEIGTHTGNTTQGKPNAEYDWYRVVHPFGKGVRVTVYGGPVNASLELTHNNPPVGIGGYPLYATHQRLRPVAGEPANFSASAVLSDPAGVRIGLFIWSPTWDYTLQVEVVDVVDIQLSGLEVREEPGWPCAFTTPTCPAAARRLHVSVEVRAIGALPYEGTLAFLASDAAPAWTEVGQVALRVEPGSVFRIGFTWTPIGAGDFDLWVLATQDANYQGNSLKARLSWVVSGTPGVILA